jgi:prophage regulatory protein
MSSQSAQIAEIRQPQAERHIMRRDEVERKTGFKRAHIYNLMKEGKFPQAKRIGLRAVGWDSL